MLPAATYLKWGVHSHRGGSGAQQLVSNIIWDSYTYCSNTYVRTYSSNEKWVRLYAHRLNSYPAKTNSWYWIYGLLQSGTFQTSRFSRMQKWKYKFVPSMNSCWRLLIWIAIFTIGMNSYPRYHRRYEFVPEILPLVRILTHYHWYEFLPKSVQICTQDSTVSIVPKRSWTKRFEIWTE